MRTQEVAVHVLPSATSTDEAERQAKVAVLPVGSFEQHGRHLPLATDTIVACAIAEAVAKRYELLLLPPLTISCSHEHAGFAGTVSISATTLQRVIVDVAISLGKQGIRSLVLVNGHGGNYVLGNVVQEANEIEPRMALFPHRDDWELARKAAGMVTGNHEDMHGGELETSVLLDVAPELVRDDFQADDSIVDERTHLHIRGMASYTPSGIIGRPSLGDAEKGRLALRALSDSFGDHLALLSSEDTQSPPG